MLTKITLKAAILPLLMVFIGVNTFGQSAGINSNGADSLLFFSGGTKTMVLGANGELRVGPNLPSSNPSAILELNSTTGGLLIPRMTTGERD